VTRRTLRVVVVDDSSFFRALIRDCLREIDGIAIVGNAANGNVALEQIQKLDPDVITLDVEMPGMDGIQVLREMKARGHRAQAIMVSRHTAAGAQVTTDALMEGAFDFVHKPSGSDVTQNKTELRNALSTILEVVRSSSTALDSVVPVDDANELQPHEQGSLPCEIVLIGSSTGGPDALRRILPALPADFPAPILIVQHMPPKYTASLASRLNDLCALDVVEAADGTQIESGRILIAPGGYQMGITKIHGKLVTNLTDAPPEHSCRPAVDYLFRSAFETLPQKRMLGVILTGMGSDGTEGCALLKDCGARIVSQHADGCVVYGMPKSVAESGLADRIVRLKHVATVLCQETRIR
jgi:two-component system chemotaxis response regulator CheB